jgi:hypothetical protein
MPICQFAPKTLSGFDMFSQILIKIEFLDKGDHEAFGKLGVMIADTYRANDVSVFLRVFYQGMDTLPKQVKWQSFSLIIA